jgi:hypothetical protein
MKAKYLGALFLAIVFLFGYILGRNWPGNRSDIEVDNDADLMRKNERNGSDRFELYAEIKVMLDHGRMKGTSLNFEMISEKALAFVKSSEKFSLADLERTEVQECRYRIFPRVMGENTQESDSKESDSRNNDEEKVIYLKDVANFEVYFYRIR